MARLPLFVNTYQHRRFPISPLKQLLHGWLSEVCKTSKVDSRRHFDEMWVIAAYLEGRRDFDYGNNTRGEYVCKGVGGCT